MDFSPLCGQEWQQGVPGVPDKCWGKYNLSLIHAAVFSAECLKYVKLKPKGVSPSTSNKVGVKIVRHLFRCKKVTESKILEMEMFKPSLDRKTLFLHSTEACLSILLLLLRKR